MFLTLCVLHIYKVYLKLQISNVIKFVTKLNTIFLLGKNKNQAIVESGANFVNFCKY